MTELHEKATSEWEHSHALKEGDELIDTGEDTRITVREVNEDGSIRIWAWGDERNGQEYREAIWDEEMVRVGLRDGIIEREDGLSHELSTW